MSRIINEIDTIAYRDFETQPITERQLLGLLSAFKMMFRIIMKLCDLGLDKQQNEKNKQHYEETIYKRMHSFDKMKGDQNETIPN